jgi:hypothetical protein
VDEEGGREGGSLRECGAWSLGEGVIEERGTCGCEADEERGTCGCEADEERGTCGCEADDFVQSTPFAFVCLSPTTARPFLEDRPHPRTMTRMVQTRRSSRSGSSPTSFAEGEVLRRTSSEDDPSLEITTAEATVRFHKKSRF